VRGAPQSPGTGGHVAGGGVWRAPVNFAVVYVRDGYRSPRNRGGRLSRNARRPSSASAVP
jgi:hypothetical protein